MIIVTATMYPQGLPSGSFELLHATIMNAGDTPGEPGHCDYNAHILARPSAQKGIEGFEADVIATTHNYRNGLAPLLSGLLGAAAPIPFDAEAQYDVLKRLTLKEMDNFDARLRGRS